MNDSLVANINSLVSAQDVLWHLGDWAFSSVAAAIEFRDRITCKTVNLIIGNHDKHRLKHEQFRKLFSRIDHQTDIRVNRQSFVLNHYSMRVWDKMHYGVYHLYGHSHSSLDEPEGYLGMDVGVDAYAKRFGIKPENYRPFTFEEIRNILSKRRFVAVDHHNEETT